MNAVKYALAEIEIIRGIVAGVDNNQIDALIREIDAAKRIFVGGAGRSLLSMKGFAMRLMQTGHETYLVGEVCTPSVQPGDILIVGSGSGDTQVTLDMVIKAKKHGAKTALITKNRDSRIAKEAHFIIELPKPDMELGDELHDEARFVKNNLGGNITETSVTFVLDGLIARLMKEKGYTEELIMFNHANLE